MEIEILRSTLINSDTLDIKSDTLDINSDTLDINSDTLDINSDTLDINSDTRDINSDTVGINSATYYRVVLLTGPPLNFVSTGSHANWPGISLSVSS